MKDEYYEKDEDRHACDDVCANEVEKVIQKPAPTGGVCTGQGDLSRSQLPREACVLDKMMLSRSQLL